MLCGAHSAGWVGKESSRGWRAVSVRECAWTTHCPSPNPQSQAAATPRTPQSPNTPLTPKLTGSSTHGPQFFDNATAPAGTNYGLELFLASEASAVVEHTKQ